MLIISSFGSLKSCAESTQSAKISSQKARKTRSESFGGVLGGETRSRELQEAPEEATGHYLMALPSEYDFPRSYEPHRWSCAPLRWNSYVPSTWSLKVSWQAKKLTKDI